MICRSGSYLRDCARIDLISKGGWYAEGVGSISLVCIIISLFVEDCVPGGRKRNVEAMAGSTFIISGLCHQRILSVSVIKTRVLTV